MYNELNKIVQNYLKGYHKRAIKNRVVDIDSAQTLSAYTRMWAKDEAKLHRSLDIAGIIDINLYEHVKCVTQHGVEITIHDNFIELLNELWIIDEELSRQEAVNLGFGKDAKVLRKKWRNKLREAHKYLDRCVRNRMLWIKEHRKPHQTYVLNCTGEVHNGLYWTLRELILHPSYIKYGFTKED